MIAVKDLTVDFGNRLLFSEANFVINQHERIALVGRNGAGKSTLLKLVAGLEQPTSGSVEVPKWVRIGYLPQVMQFKEERTLLDEVLQVFAHTQELEKEYEQITQSMQERTDYESEEYTALIERHAYLVDLLGMEHQGAYLAQAEQTLLGLGFERTDFNRETREFSGGWRMRIELAKVLLSKPDLLLLDEPTNHLDIESIQWLESYIASSGAALLLVSHDRAFLDATTQRTIEIDLSNLYDYKTHYSHYLTLREERRAQQQRAYENQQRLIEKTEEFIEKFRYKPTKSVQVQNRIKQLEKLERLEVDEHNTTQVHFHFLTAGRSGDYPVIIDSLGKSYGTHQVLQNVSLTVKRGQKVAFVGKNGSGKSTLVKCIMNQITDYTGTLKVGHGVECAYFSQNRAQELDGRLTVRETIDRVAVGDIRTHINDMLGAFLFGGEDADKKVAVLSGGERSRVALLQLLLEPANLLVLDEPTNHLDIQTKEILKQALLDFTGTVILVSHDRYLLDGLADVVYEFHGGGVREHMGGIQGYLAQHRAELKAQAAPKSANTSATVPEPQPSDAAEAYRRNKELNKQIRSLERKIADAETQIAALEAKKKELEALLASGHAAEEDFVQYGTLQNQLAEWEERWETDSMALEELRSSL